MGYSESFKLKVVSEYEGGKTSFKALQNKYNIGGNETVRNWVKSYGNLGLSSDTTQIDDSVRVSEKLESITLKNELEQARIRIAALEALIDISSKQTGIDLKKKFGGKL
jgi:transposase-like protein